MYNVHVTTEIVIKITLHFSERDFPMEIIEKSLIKNLL
jgi:hypothetical protein